MDRRRLRSDGRASSGVRSGECGSDPGVFYGTADRFPVGTVELAMTYTSICCGSLVLRPTSSTFPIPCGREIGSLATASGTAPGSHPGSAYRDCGAQPENRGR